MNWYKSSNDNVTIYQQRAILAHDVVKKCCHGEENRPDHCPTLFHLLLNLYPLIGNLLMKENILIKKKLNKNADCK